VTAFGPSWCSFAANGRIAFCVLLSFPYNNSTPLSTSDELVVGYSK